MAIPLTILWVVGITNAFNLLDNMDGLSAGMAVIAAAFLFAFTSRSATWTWRCCAGPRRRGARLPVYNFNPARIFMGDSAACTSASR